MTKEEVANHLNGISYHDIQYGSWVGAKQDGLVVVFGASDDLMEFEGAISKEIYVSENDEVFLSKDGFFDGDCDCECKYFQAAKKEFESNAKKISVFWDKEDYSWIYETDIPHATFDVPAFVGHARCRRTNHAHKTAAIRI